MNKDEFIPFELAERLKRLEFNEPSVALFWLNGELFIDTVEKYHNDRDEVTTAPTYRQVFKWFREKHNLEATVSCFYNDKLDIPYEDRTYHVFIVRKGVTSKKKNLKSYEEGELECIKKLIEIID